MATDKQTSIESVLHEDRVFEPPSDFSEHSHISSFSEYEKIYDEAAQDPVGFWESVAKGLHWFEHWHTALEWNEPFAKWFVGGKTNVSYNCIDRHLSTHRRNKAAIIWEGEPEDEVRTITFQQLHQEVCRFCQREPAELHRLPSAVHRREWVGRR